MKTAWMCMMVAGCSWPFGADTPSIGDAAASGSAPASAAPTVPVQLEGRALGLQVVASDLDRPLLATGAGDGSGRVYIVEQGGRVWRVDQGERTLWLDLTQTVSTDNNEQGLLGMAFHPRLAERPFVYLNYTVQGGGPAGRSIIARAPLSTDVVPDLEGLTELLSVAQPAGNHNGGHLTFGPDGMLYAGFGDGGAAGDRFKNSRDPKTLLAKLLRLDIDAEPSQGRAYAIPSDNPFADGNQGAPEIWAMGLRNPWRFSFDAEGGSLWIADVGQNKYEEAHVAPIGVGGIDYGWRVLEGTHCFDPATDCPRDGLALPVVEYEHPTGCSITGGHVYRGSAIPELQGAYLAADYCTGKVWTARHAGWSDASSLTATSPAVIDPRAQTRVAEAGKLDANVSSFGLDDAGELLIVDHDGTVYRLVPGA